MLQDLARGALWVQVQDKTSHDTSLLHRSVGLFCAAAQSTHPHTPANRTPTPHKQWASPQSSCSGWAIVGQRGVGLLAVRGLPRCSTIPRRLLWRCPPPWAQAQEAPRASPPRPAPPPASKGFAIPPLPAGPWGEEVPAPSPPPLPHPVPARSSLLRLQQPPWHWQVPQRRHLQDPVTALP